MRNSPGNVGPAAARVPARRVRGKVPARRVRGRVRAARAPEELRADRVQVVRLLLAPRRQPQPHARLRRLPLRPPHRRHAVAARSSSAGARRGRNRLHLRQRRRVRRQPVAVFSSDWACRVLNRHRSRLPEQAGRNCSGGASPAPRLPTQARRRRRHSRRSRRALPFREFVRLR